MMQITKLFIRNIGPFRGEHALDFAESQLMNAGLFAITGQTGSGKSTVLDVICLALYGANPRLGHINAEHIVHDHAVISFLSKEAEARITFISKNSHFESWWKVNASNSSDINIENGLNVIHEETVEA